MAEAIIKNIDVIEKPVGKEIKKFYRVYFEIPELHISDFVDIPEDQYDPAKVYDRIKEIVEKHINVKSLVVKVQ